MNEKLTKMENEIKAQSDKLSEKSVADQFIQGKLKLQNKKQINIIRCYESSGRRNESFSIPK